jgi:hypothetical protein
MKTRGLRFCGVQKSAQTTGSKGDRSKNIGRFAGLKVGMFEEKEVRRPDGIGIPE